MSARARFIIHSIILTLLFSSAGVRAATTAQINTAWTNGLAWLFQNQKGDGRWTAISGLEMQSTSAVLEAYLNAGIMRGNSYNAAVAKLANGHPASIDGKARQVATLRRAAYDVSGYVGQLQAGDNFHKAWGSLPGYDSSPADTALALSVLLDALGPSYTSQDAATVLCSALLPTQQGTGGWSYASLGASLPATAAKASILPTAYTILLLKKINATRFTGVTCNGTSYTLATVINNAVNFLVTQQNATDHGFGDDGTSGALETALASLAIAAVNPTHAALGPAQDYLISSQQTSGAWANDPLQTALVLQSFPAPAPALTFSGNDGIPDVVKIKLGITTVADGRRLLPGNGQSVGGVTTSKMLANATPNQAFRYTLTASSGTGPFTFTLLTGSLPDGLTLASNGLISGTPTTVGSFNFTYQIVDSQYLVTAVAGNILIGVDDSDVPTLPPWGLIVMAGLLLSSMVVLDRRRNNGYYH